MESKVKVAGHPVHPMLVTFPIACYTAAAVCFIAYRYFNIDAFWFKAGLAANIAGVATAILAAAFGLIDWSLAIPQNNAAKNIGIIHAAWNTLALFFFALNLFLQNGKWNAINPAPGSSAGITFLGLLCAIAASYYGYEMVQRYYVGIATPSERPLARPEQTITIAPMAPGMNADGSKRKVG